MVSADVDVDEYTRLKEENARLVNNHEVMVTTAEVLEEQARERTAENYYLKMDHDVLPEEYEDAHPTNSMKLEKSWKDKEAALDLHTSWSIMAYRANSFPR